MKINHAEVTYGELRSAGYPSFSNKRIEVTLGAFLESGEDPESVKDRLYIMAKIAVKKKFGDKAEQTEMDLPF
jgi:hypothetical protein